MKDRLSSWRDEEERAWAYKELDEGCRIELVDVVLCAGQCTTPTGPMHVHDISRHAMREIWRYLEYAALAVPFHERIHLSQLHCFIPVK